MEFSSENKVIEPRKSGLVGTGIAIQCPEGTYGRLCSRSGIALNYGVDVAGVIDRDYTGNILVLLRNNSDETFIVSKGMRIAQLILERNYIANIVKVDVLGNTERGDQGFGSTGTQ